MKERLIHALKRLLARAGLELNRLDSSNSERALAWRLISASGADLVVDIGANEGQYALALLSIRKDLRIVSFEPLSSARLALLERSRRYRNWTVAERMALGSSRGAAKLFVSGNSLSSSLLPMLPAHLSAAPASAYVREEATPLERLDDVAGRYWSPSDRLMLKIDAQGYEADVLAGTRGIMRQVTGIQMEISFVPLYEGQMLANEAIRQIEGMGFSLFAINSDFSDPNSHALLQANAFFLRTAT
jgi:FkbM family methyltransferase